MDCDVWAPVVGGVQLREGSLSPLSQRSHPSSLLGQVGQRFSYVGGNNLS